MHPVTFLASLGGLNTEWRNPEDLVWQCDHPLNCQVQWFEEVSDYLFPGRRCPHICRGFPLVAYKWSPNQCVKDTVNTNQVVFSFLARAFAPDLYDLIWSFSSWPLQSCQWPPDPATSKTECLEPTSRQRATWTWSPTLEGPWRDGSIGQFPLPLAILVPSQRAATQLS